MKKVIFMMVAMVMSFSAGAYEVGKVKTSGMIMKDSIEIHGFLDPTLTGVGCHVTLPKKSLSFSDPTNSSVSCRQVSPTITGDYTANVKNLFKAKKNLFFKTMRVDRFYDATTNSLVYITYTKKLTGDNASHSISDVPLYNAVLKGK